MENILLNKNIRLSTSILDEIRAKDIYTVTSPDCPTIPNVTLSIPNPYLLSGESQEGDQINSDPFSDDYSGQEVSSAILQQNKQLKLKRLSIGKYQNLPAVLEEDFYVNRLKVDSNPFSVEASMGDEEANELAYGRMKEEIDFYLNNCQDGNISDEESWVDLSGHTRTPPLQNTMSGMGTSMSAQSTSSPDRVTPTPFGNGEEYLRLLREAQKESNQSSARVSHASSRKDTPRDSPKSPPNSPNTEMALQPETAQLKEVYINYYNREGDFVRVEKNIETDWIWDWSSRPDQTPPKEWHFVHPRKGVVVPGRGASLRKMMVGNTSIFSRDVLYTLLLTNVLSLLLGTGIGIWLTKRSGGPATVSAMSIN